MIRNIVRAALVIIGLTATSVSAEEPFIVVQSTTSTLELGPVGLHSAGV